MMFDPLVAILAATVATIIIEGIAIIYLYYCTKLLMRCVVAQADQQVENEKFITASRDVFVTAQAIERIVATSLDEEEPEKTTESMH